MRFWKNFSSMRTLNHTGASHTIFCLLGIPGLEDHYMWISIPFVISYATALLGNSLFLFIILTKHSLHEPMFLFLCMLSGADLVLSTCTVPQALAIFWFNAREISLDRCITQLFFIHSTFISESGILLVMAFDRFVAVCRPLHYTTIMNPRLCWLLAAIAWLGGLGNSVVQSTFTLQLPLCGHRRVDSFLCEVPAMIKLACVDTSLNEAVLNSVCTFFTAVPLSVILISYCYIAQAVLKIRSAEGRRKAFNTCLSHLVVVLLFYGSAIYGYLLPAKTSKQDQGKFISLFYSVVTPMVNPLIYTLRNKDVKGALRRLVQKDRAQQSEKL